MQILYAMYAVPDSYFLWKFPANRLS